MWQGHHLWFWMSIYCIVPCRRQIHSHARSALRWMTHWKTKREHEMTGKKGKYKRKQRKNKAEDISATLCLQWSAQVYSYILPNKGCALKRKWAFPALAHHHVHEVAVSFLKKGCTQEDDRKFSILVIKVTLLAFPFSPSPVTVTVCALCVSRCVFLCVIVCLHTLEALIRRVRRERAFIH